MRCNNCGFRFTQNFPDEKEIGPYYETAEYVSHSDTHKGLTNKLYHVVRHFMLNRKADMTERISGKTRGTILDIGCGTGYYLHVMHQRGWHCLGVEKSELASNSARNHFGLEILSSLDKTDTNQRFDVITLWHVLEHLQNLSDVFARLRGLLSEEGTLIVAVPNCDSYDAHYYKEYWGAYDVPRHLWHFTPHTLGLLARREGFKIEQFAPMPFDAFYVSILSERYQHKRLAFLKGMWRGAVALMHSLKNPQKSSSIIYILKRIK
jgi:Methyltransferase domain.